MIELSPEILLARGYKYDYDMDWNDNPCELYQKNGLSLRDLGDGLFEVKGQEIDTVEELEQIEANIMSNETNFKDDKTGFYDSAGCALMIFAIPALLATCHYIRG